jgi:hypothetical protein
MADKKILDNSIIREVGEFYHGTIEFRKVTDANEKHGYIVEYHVKNSDTGELRAVNLFQPKESQKNYESAISKFQQFFDLPIGQKVLIVIEKYETADTIKINHKIAKLI